MSEKKLKINLVERFARFLMSDEPEEQEQLEVKTYALKEDNSVSVTIDDSGAVVFSDGREVVDGEYPLDGGLVLVITDGKGEVKQAEVKEDEAQEESPLDEVAELKAQFNAQLADANAKVAAFENEVANFATVKENLEKTIADLTAEVENLKSQIPSKVGEFNVNDKQDQTKANRWAVYGE